jgi:hypothetical protein
VAQVCEDHANQHPGIQRTPEHSSPVESHAIRLEATYSRLLESNASPQNCYTDLPHGGDNNFVLAERRFTTLKDGGELTVRSVEVCDPCK